MKQQCGTSTPALLVGATSTAVGATPHCCRSDSALLVGATRTAGLQHPHCCLCEPALLVTATRVQVGLSLWRRALTGVFHWLFSQESTVHGAVAHVSILCCLDGASSIANRGRKCDQ